MKNKKWLLLVLLLGLLCGLQVVRAEAASTNMIASARRTTGGRWVQTEDGQKYRTAKGKYVRNSWRSIDGKVYYFNASGVCETGWFTYENARYYANRKGAVCSNRWLKKGSGYYYLKANGQMAVSRMVKTDEKWYYVGSDGVRVTSSWITKNGKKYYFDRDGVRLEKRWLKKNGNYYYLGEDGVMAVSQWIGLYYVGEDGVRVTDTTVDGYQIGSDGKRTQAMSGYIFVGDSRMVGMSMAVSSSKLKYIAKVGMGYSWLNGTAGSTLKKELSKNPYRKVVLGFGINDLGNIQSYITYYKKLIRKYPDTEFYMLSVNPVKEKKASAAGYSVKNSAIREFNRKLKAAFPSRYINSFSYLLKNGIETTDGIHYHTATYTSLYHYIIEKIG